MKLHLTALAVLLAVAPGAWAQSAISGYQLSGTDLNGTARYQAMAGAFTALGGDMSTLHNNPGGIGVYNRSDLSLTGSVDFQRATTTSQGVSNLMTQTRGAFENMGYIGTYRMGNSVMRTLSWGVSYTRQVSFDRYFSGYTPHIGTSMSNYVAAFSNGYTPDQLLDAGSYNPYIDSQCDWLSILAYNTSMINPTGKDTYEGLYRNGTDGDSEYTVHEKGYVDEYTFNVGGNVSDCFYWGLGFGVTDLDYTRSVYYDESMAGARIANAEANGTADGKANFDINNWKHVSGTGYNFNIGFIVKPVNELRIGLAIKTPTWYDLTENYQAAVNYAYYGDGYEYVNKQPYNSEYANFDWKLQTPWRLQLGVAGVIGQYGIISVDYERQFFKDMTVKSPVYGSWSTSFENDQATEREIGQYFRAVDIVRVGGELRALPWLSLRLGYAWQGASSSQEMRDGQYEVFTSGTDPSYTMDKTTQYITGGIGLRYQAFSFDIALVHKIQSSTFKPYTDFGPEGQWQESPAASVTNRNNKLVFTAGFKF